MTQIESSHVKFTQDLAVKLGITCDVFAPHGHAGSPYRAALSYCLRQTHGHTYEQLADLMGYAAAASVHKQVKRLEAGDFDKSIKRTTGSRLGAREWCDKFCRAWIKQQGK